MTLQSEIFEQPGSLSELLETQRKPVEKIAEAIRQQ